MCGAKTSSMGPVGAGEAVILNRDESWSLLNLHAPSFVTGQGMIILIVIMMAICYFGIRTRRRNRLARHMSAATMMDLGQMSRLTQTVPAAPPVIDYPVPHFQSGVNPNLPTAPNAPGRSAELQHLQNLAIRYGRNLA